ncbi:MAG TPA: hypothetical protein VK786_06720 [bacterium]|jgi:hypothetical protein|nr:hypothetical protein [bacterium]
MLRMLRAFIAILVFPSFLGAIGLAQGDSYAGLSALRPPLRITWTVDGVTTRMVGGGAGLGDALGTAAFKRLKAAGVPMQDGAFDPLGEPFVSLDLWARGVTKAEDPHDPQRVFNFQLQVYAPADGLKGQSGRKGRVTVWERSVYGACAAGDIKDQVRLFLGLCGLFGADWRAAHGLPGAPGQE